MKTRKFSQCLLQRAAPSPSPLSLRPLRYTYHLPLPFLHPYPRKPTLRSLTTTSSLPFPEDPIPTAPPHQDPPLPPPTSTSTPNPDATRRLISETFNLRNASRTPRNSADDLAAARHATALRTPEAELRANREGSIASLMNFPNQPSPSDPSRAVISDLRAATEAAITLVPRATRTVKSRPSVGRTVEVGPQGVARALQILGRECRDNNVRGDQIRDRFHERKGMKRKRLRRERWRRRFGEGFRATVRLVTEMRRKGW